MSLHQLAWFKLTTLNPNQFAQSLFTSKRNNALLCCAPIPSLLAFYEPEYAELTKFILIEGSAPAGVH